MPETMVAPLSESTLRTTSLRDRVNARWRESAPQQGFSALPPEETTRVLPFLNS